VDLLTGNIPDGFDRRNDIGDQQGNHGRPVKADREGLDPQKGDWFRGRDDAGVDVCVSVEVGDAGNKVTKEEGQDDVAVLHKDAPEQFDKDEEHEDGKTESDVLRGSVELARFAVGARGEGRSEANVLLRGDLGVSLPSHFGTDDTAAPVLHSGSGQGDPDENDGYRGHDGREELLEAVDGQNRKGKFEEAADHGRSEHGPIGDPSVDSVAFHLVNGDFVDGQEGKGCPHDTQHPGTNIDDPSKYLFGEGHGNLENVDDGANTGCDQAGADGVLKKNKNRIIIEHKKVTNHGAIVRQPLSRTNKQTNTSHHLPFEFSFALRTHLNQIRTESFGKATYGELEDH
jgi:hypothetical protein